MKELRNKRTWEWDFFIWTMRDWTAAWTSSSEYRTVNLMALRRRRSTKDSVELAALSMSRGTAAAGAASGSPSRGSSLLISVASAHDNSLNTLKFVENFLLRLMAIKILKCTRESYPLLFTESNPLLYSL